MELLEQAAAVQAVVSVEYPNLAVVAAGYHTRVAAAGYHTQAVAGLAAVAEAAAGEVPETAACVQLGPCYDTSVQAV